MNSSQYNFAVTTSKRLIHDKVMWTVNILTIVGLAVILYSPLHSFLKLTPLSLGQLGCALALAAVSVLWYELVKIYQRNKKKRGNTAPNEMVDN